LQRGKGKEEGAWKSRCAADLLALFAVTVEDTVTGGVRVLAQARHLHQDVDSASFK
jgi:hypothetical protein